MGTRCLQLVGCGGRPQAEEVLRPPPTPPGATLTFCCRATPSPMPLPAQEIEQRGVQPELYPYGSRGPVGAHYLAAKHGVRWGDLGDDE